MNNGFIKIITLGALFDPGNPTVLGLLLLLTTMPTAQDGNEVR